jgi:hypothetical protein
MKTVIWGVSAAIFIFANFVVRLALDGPQTPSDIAGAFGEAIGPMGLAALCMIPARFRGWANFLKFTTIFTVMALLSSLGDFKPPR